MNKKIISFIFFSQMLIGQAFNGMTIFSPIQSNEGNFTTFLIDNELNVINLWNHPRGPASMAYLQTDSTLLYPYRVQNPTMNSGGVGGGISLYLWNGDLIWDYNISNETYQHHHDIEPLPNGNILILVWEKKNAAEATEVGRQELNNSLNEIWSEALLEIEPISYDSFNVVWEWHLWDHLIQDVDPTLANYGVISEHPELQDVNYGDAGNNQGPGGPHGDWKHFNSVAYNDYLDQIVLSSRAHDEIYIIDHSTTTSEAGGHTGGISGKGGDYLYRWGNPQAYGRGSEQNHLLHDQHGVNWISYGYPGEGNLILFNNNNGNNISAVLEIIPPMYNDNTYIIDSEIPIGPDFPTWIYSDGFHTQMQGGAFRLPNGNTIVTDCDDATFFEINPDNEIVWSYDHGGPNVMIARVQKYDDTYLESEFPNYTIGDINFDETLNIFDLTYLSDMVHGFGYSPTPPADINLDGIVNSEDVNLLIELLMNYD
jgi:hypothetical protein